MAVIYYSKWNYFEVKYVTNLMVINLIGLPNRGIVLRLNGVEKKAERTKGSNIKAINI